MTGEYEGVRRIVYGGDEGATFIPVCVKCGRFVKPDKQVYVGERNLRPGANADCKKCGRTEMLFEGFI